MTFAEKLQVLRKRRSLSQEQLAAALGVSRQAISKWELNAAVPDVENLIKLSALFSVSTDYLLKEELEDDALSKEPGGNGDRSGFRRCVALMGCLGGAVLGDGSFAWPG